VGNTPPVKLLDYLLDKYEVTNREFKKFLDGGGYKKPEVLETTFREGWPYSHLGASHPGIS